MSYQPDIDFAIPDPADDQSLIHLLDRLLDQGIILSGDLSISVAGIDLLFVGLKVLVASTDTAERYRLSANSPEAA